MSSFSSSSGKKHQGWGQVGLRRCFWQLSRSFLHHLLPRQRTFFNVCLIDGAARIFPNSCAPCWNQIHISSVAPLLRDLNQGCFTDWATAAMAKFLALVTTLLDGAAKLIFFFSYLESLNHRNFLMADSFLPPYTQEIWKSFGCPWYWTQVTCVDF